MYNLWHVVVFSYLLIRPGRAHKDNDFEKIPVGRSFSSWNKSCSETCFGELLEAFCESKAHTFMWVPCKKTTRNFPARFLNCSTLNWRLNWRIFFTKLFQTIPQTWVTKANCCWQFCSWAVKKKIPQQQKIVHCFVSNISALFFLSHDLLMSLICYCPSTFTCTPEWTFIRKLPFQQKLSGNKN